MGVTERFRAVNTSNSSYSSNKSNSKSCLSTHAQYSTTVTPTLPRVTWIKDGGKIITSVNFHKKAMSNM